MLTPQPNYLRYTFRLLAGTVDAGSTHFNIRTHTGTQIASMVQQAVSDSRYRPSILWLNKNPRIRPNVESALSSSKNESPLTVLASFRMSEFGIAANNGVVQRVASIARQYFRMGCSFKSELQIKILLME